MFKVERYKTLEYFQNALNNQPDWLLHSWTVDQTWGAIAVYVKQDTKEPAVTNKVVTINRIPIQTSPFPEIAEKSAHDWNNVAAFTPKPESEEAA